MRPAAEPGPDPAATEVLRGGSSLMTTHAAADYPGLTVVQVGRWTMRFIVPEDGQTVVGRGGESVYAYELPNGVKAQGFSLGPGDRATRVRSNLPHSLAEWRIARAARP